MISSDKFGTLRHNLNMLEDMVGRLANPYICDTAKENLKGEFRNLRTTIKNMEEENGKTEKDADST